MKWEMALVLLPGLIIGLTVHEFAHAWSASLLGDNFPRRQGRVSLNPLRHLSALGTLAIFLLPFGWGKPVIVNLYNFKRPKRDYLISSLAGPLANLVVVALCMALMQITRHTYMFGPGLENSARLADVLLRLIMVVNVMLAVINLLPVPPLDGSKIWPCIIPGLKPGVGKRMTWVFLGILLLLVYSGSLDRVVTEAIGTVDALAPVSDDDAFRQECSAAGKAIHAGDWAKARDHYTRAIAINPRSAEAYCERAAASAYLGDWNGAKADMARAEQLDPTVAKAIGKTLHWATAATQAASSQAASQGATSSSPAR